MAKNSISKISNAFSTGGGGVNFEQQIQAMFLLSLLIDGFCPAMNEQTKKVHFQAKHLGHDVLLDIRSVKQSLMQDVYIS